MKSDFVLAITQLAAEKNLPREVVLKAVESALVSAYRKDRFAPNQKITVKIHPSTGNVAVWAEKTVVDKPADIRSEIALQEAQRLQPEIQIGDTIDVEATPRNAGRIAAQTAKQVILQRLHEAEHNAIFEEYIDKEGDIVTGLVQHIESGQIFINLGRAEAVLPSSEQVRTERYRIGQRLKAYLLEVARTNRGPRVIVSRSHPNLIRRLFELEVPEVLSGAVEIKSIAREAGYRSKVAVAARQKGIDPVGSCVGLRGIRIQNIVNELNGEKLDVVLWDPDPSIYIANALSPAQTVIIQLEEGEEIATVIVPDRQLSLAIGKEGQNARLAAKLTGWRIDIKSASAVEADRLQQAKAPAEKEIPKEISTITEPLVEPSDILIGTEEEVSTEEVESVTVDIEEVTEVPYVPPDSEEIQESVQVRFAEEIMPPTATSSSTKSKKKKRKQTWDKSKPDEGIKQRKRRTDEDFNLEDEEY